MKVNGSQALRCWAKSSDPRTTIHVSCCPATGDERRFQTIVNSLDEKTIMNLMRIETRLEAVRGTPTLDLWVRAVSIGCENPEGTTFPSGFLSCSVTGPPMQFIFYPVPSTVQAPMWKRLVPTLS